MYKKFLLLNIFFCIIESDGSHLNEIEREITLKMIESLNIDHCIIAHTFSYNQGDVAYLKSLMYEWDVPVSLYSVREIHKRVVDESYFNALTTFVFKIEKWGILTDLLLSLKTVKKLQLVRNFSWLIFTDQPEIRIEGESLPVPLDCEFIIVHPYDSKTYKLVEFYTLRNKSMYIDYGAWDGKSGLTITNLSVFRRKNNVNNTDFLYNSEDPNIWNCDTVRRCANNEVLLYVTSMSNFNVIIVTPDELRNVYNQEEGDALNKMALLHPSYVKYNLLAPLFKVKVNWYIGRLSTAMQADYFIKIFNLDLWSAIGATVILGGITFIAICILLKKYTKNKIYNFTDGALIVFEYFCGQDTTADSDCTAFKMATFAYQLAALIIIPTYSAFITAYLSVIISKIPFRDLTTFVRNGEYRLGINPAKQIFKFFQKSPEPLLQQVYKQFVDPISEEKALKKLCKEKFAFICADNDIYEHDLDCDLYEIKQPIASSNNAIELATDTPYRGLLRYNLLAIFSSGIHDRMRHKILSEVDEKEKKNFASVEFEQVVLLLSIVGMGVGLSWFILLIELLIKYFASTRNHHRRKLRKV